eukprot:IDg8016t1
MDTKRFVNWIRWWYEEVKKSIEQWCLSMDNCEGNNRLPDLNVVNIVLLPENTTAVCQLLDQGLISMKKIQYRSSLLRETIDILLRMQESKNNFKFTTGNGIRGVKEGQRHHVRDAINLMDTAWAKVPVSANVRF